MLSPAEFLRDSEGAVAMAEIGAFALDLAARELAAWQKALDVNPPIFALLGLFSRQMLAHDLLGDIRAVLGRHAIARGSLKLGVSESLVMENPEFAAQLLPRARELGAGVALDDFGSGYTSLGEIERYHFDTLKIGSSLAKPRGGTGRSVGASRRGRDGARSRHGRDLPTAPTTNPTRWSSRSSAANSPKAWPSACR